MTERPSTHPAAAHDVLPREEYTAAAAHPVVLGWTLLDSRDPGRDTPAQAQALAALHRRHAVYLKQVHGTECVVLRSGEGLPPVPVRADGILTDRRDLLAGVSAADCLPLFLIARGSAAVLHAGWRGVLGGILPLAMERMQEHFGVRPEELRLFVGPGIGPCCFEVSAAVWSLFAPACRTHGSRGLRLDLVRAVEDQWRRSGGREPLCHVGRCTACSQPRLHSYRRDGGHGRNFAYICFR